MTQRDGIKVTVIPDTTAINELLSGRTGDLRRVMAGFAGQATQTARTYASTRLKVRTGTYVRSIHSTFPRPDEFRIESSAPYAASLELGTGDHRIEARNARALVFYWDAIKDVFVGQAVNHPGNKAYNVLTDAVLDTAKRIGF